MAEQLIMLLGIIAMFNFLLQVSVIRTWWHVWISALVMALLIWCMHYYAIEQTIGTISVMLKDKDVMGNIVAVIVTGTGLQLLLNNRLLKSRLLSARPSWWGNAVSGIAVLLPSLVLTGCMLYAEIEAFVYFSFSSFQSGAMMMAIGVLVFIITGSYGCKRMLPAVVPRLELRYYLLLIQLLMALLLGASVTIIPQELDTPMSFSFGPFIVLMIIVALLAVAGYVVSQRRYIRKIQKQRNN